MISSNVFEIGCTFASVWDDGGKLISMNSFDNLLLNFDYLIHALTSKEYFLSSIEGTFRVMLWFFMMWVGGLIAIAGLIMMK